MLRWSYGAASGAMGVGNHVHKIEYASIAQSVEQRAFNSEVGGSIPSARTMTTVEGYGDSVNQGQMTRDRFNSCVIAWSPWCRIQPDSYCWEGRD